MFFYSMRSREGEEVGKNWRTHFKPQGRREVRVAGDPERQVGPEVNAELAMSSPLGFRFMKKRI